MNAPAEPLKRVAILIRDLLAVDESLVRIGRQNFEQADFETAYYVVDSLAQAQSVSSLEIYDGDTEVLKLGSVWREAVTVDVYGPNAYSRAIELCLKLRSQAARELRDTLGVAVYHPKGPTDLKQLTGQQYGERQQLEMQVEISLDVSIATKRIDTVQLEIRTEKGIQ